MLNCATKPDDRLGSPSSSPGTPTTPAQQEEPSPVDHWLDDCFAEAEARLDESLPCSQAGPFSGQSLSASWLACIWAKLAKAPTAEGATHLSEAQAQKHIHACTHGNRQVKPHSITQTIVELAAHAALPPKARAAGCLLS